MVSKSRDSRQTTRQEALAAGHVVPEPTRCVQCGICSFYCPIGIDVRRHAWSGKHVTNPLCLSCGECIQRCPRGVLRFEQLKIFKVPAR